MLWERAPPLPRRARTAAGSNRSGLERRRLVGTAHSQHETWMKEGRAGAPPNRSPGPLWSRVAGGGGDAKDRWLSSCREAGAEVCGGHLRRAFGVRRDVGCADRSWGWPPVGQGNHEDASAVCGVPDAGRWGEAGGLRRARDCSSTSPDPLPMCSMRQGRARSADGPVKRPAAAGPAVRSLLALRPEDRYKRLGCFVKRLSKSRTLYPSRSTA